jgi:hypothetical protein
MRGWTIFVLGIFAVVAPTAAADPPLVDGVSGAPVAWTGWVAKRGPVAVLVWASWAPRAEAVMDEYEEIAEACASLKLHLVVLDVHESLEDGRAALGPHGVSWIHDRHGALLKQYHVIKVPSLVLLSADNQPSARLEPTAAAVLERGRH